MPIPMPIRKSREEIQKLREADRLWREGENLVSVAQTLGFNSAGGLVRYLHELGFALVRKGGLRLVTTLDPRIEFQALHRAGEIAPAEEPVAMCEREPVLV